MVIADVSCLLLSLVWWLLRLSLLQLSVAVAVVVAVVAFVVGVGAVVLAMVAFSKPRRAGRDRCFRHCHRGCSRLKSVASCYSNVKRRRLYPQTRGHMEPESANVLQLSGGPTMALVRQN